MGRAGTAFLLVLSVPSLEVDVRYGLGFALLIHRDGHTRAWFGVNMPCLSNSLLRTL